MALFRCGGGDKPLNVMSGNKSSTTNTRNYTWTLNVNKKVKAIIVNAVSNNEPFIACSVGSFTTTKYASGNNRNSKMGEMHDVGYVSSMTITISNNYNDGILGGSYIILYE